MLTDEEIVKAALLIQKEENDELEKLLDQAGFLFVSVLIFHILQVENNMEDALQKDYEEIQEIVTKMRQKYPDKIPNKRKLTKLLKKRSFIKNLEEQVIPEIRMAFFALFEEFNFESNSDALFNYASKHYKEIEKWLKKLPKLLKETTDQAVIRNVQTAYKEEKDDNWLDGIIAGLWVFGYTRSRSVAILETLRAYSGSHYESAQQNDAIVGFRWRHQDGVKEPRSSHVASDGIVMPKNIPFLINGVRIRYPRDPSLPPEESINCHCYLENVYEQTLESGAKQRSFEENDALADQIYEAARNRKSDISRVSKHSGMKKSDITKVYNHMFINEYELTGGKKRFDPDIDMAESWQRLFIGKNIQKHDIIMLKHELLEYKLMNKDNYSYREAHLKTNQKWNYEAALNKYKEESEGV